MAAAKKTTSVVKPQKSTAIATTSFTEDMEALKNQLNAPSGDKIKVDNKTFKLPSGASAEELDVVIVDFVHCNNYYESAYQEGVIVPPSCFAISPEPNGMTPSQNSPDVQSQVGCAGCVQNQFGSAGKGKACQNRILVAVLPADMETTTAETPLAIIDLSPTTVKPFQQYIASVARALQRPPYGVVSHVSCDPTKKWDAIMFSEPQPFDMEDEEAQAFVAMIRGRREEARARLLTEPDVAALQAANDARAAAPGRSKLKAPVKRRA